MSLSGMTSGRAAWLGFLMVAAGATLWGTGGVAAKALFLTTTITPLAVGFYRLALSVPVLMFANGLRGSHWGLAWNDPRNLVVVALGAAMALYQVFYYAAVHQAGVTIATLVTLCTAPIIVAVISSLVLNERLSRLVAISLVMALIGTALLVGFPSDMTDSRDSILAGVALALGSATSYAVLTVCSRALSNVVEPAPLIVVSFGGGAVVLLPFVLAEGLSFGFPLEAWGLLVYLGLVPTSIAYILFFVGLRTTPATVASILTLMEPLTAAFLAWLIFGERLGPFGLLGAALLICAMILLTRSRGTRNRPAFEHPERSKAE